MGRYDGKRVLITGGASGIGLATARLLLEEGARVVVTGRSDHSLAAAREALGPDVTVMASDAASLDAIDALAARTRESLGGLEALLICAGQTRFTPFEQMSEEDYDQLQAVNAKGPYFAVQRLAPLIAEGGAVVVITSVAGALGLPMISGYAASKAALRSMVRSFARELLPRGVRVNAVSPGPIDSGILEKSMSPEAAEHTREQMTRENPMGRFGRPEEVARAMAFLAFDATYTTGAELVVDGGATQI